MIVSWNWLKEYVRLDMPVETLTIVKDRPACSANANFNRLPNCFCSGTPPGFRMLIACALCRSLYACTTAAGPE